MPLPSHSVNPPPHQWQSLLGCSPGWCQPERFEGNCPLSSDSLISSLPLEVPSKSPWDGGTRAHWVADLLFSHSAHPPNTGHSVFSCRTWCSPLELFAGGYMYLLRDPWCGYAMDPPKYTQMSLIPTRTWKTVEIMWPLSRTTWPGHGNAEIRMGMKCSARRILPKWKRWRFSSKREKERTFRGKRFGSDQYLSILDSKTSAMCPTIQIYHYLSGLSVRSHKSHRWPSLQMPITGLRLPILCPTGCK